MSQADPGTSSEVAADDGQFTVRVEPVFFFRKKAMYTVFLKLHTIKFGKKLNNFIHVFKFRK